jgi:hypothetical protein
MEEYMTLIELATFLGVSSTASLRKQIRAGRLAAKRIGAHTLLVSRAEAERYRAEQHAAPGKRGRPPKLEGTPSEHRPPR